MTASIRAPKFKYSEIHKFKLSSAESQQKRKRALDNAQKAKKRKLEAQQTSTLDLLKGLCKKNQKMMLEVFRVNEIGEPKILRPLSADEAHTDVFKSLRSQSHYNSLLFLHKNGCFQLTFASKWMNCLNKWQARSKLSLAHV